MSEGLPPQPPPQPGDPPAAPPPAGPPPETLQTKVQRFIQQNVMPPADPALDTPEAKLQRVLWILVGVGLVIFLLCGFLYLVFGILF